MPSLNPEILDMHQLADLLGLSYSHLSLLYRQNSPNLPPTVIRGSRRIALRSVVDAWLEKQSNTSARF